jgi:DNA topoisomerase-2
MNFEYSAKTKEWIARVSAFMDKHIYPNVGTFAKQHEEGDRWVTPQIVHDLKAIAKKNKHAPVKQHQIRQHMYLFVNALVENPSFDSQTKENMTRKAKDFGSTCALSEAFLKNVGASGIVDSVLHFAKLKSEAQMSRSHGGSKKTKITGIPKLDDANEAGGRNSHKCTLILTEGDSAKALAVSGLGIVGRDYYGVFPLRGKLLNVRDANHKQIMENAEIKHICQIMGLKFQTTYDSVKSLRYGRLMIMADQDQDGSHIKGLLINFIHHYWPSLLQARSNIQNPPPTFPLAAYSLLLSLASASGLIRPCAGVGVVPTPLQLEDFLVEFVTPIVKVSKGKTEKSFFTLPQYEAWCAEQPSMKGWKIKYYKGTPPLPRGCAWGRVTAAAKRAGQHSSPDSCSGIRDTLPVCRSRYKHPAGGQRILLQHGHAPDPVPFCGSERL